MWDRNNKINQTFLVLSPNSVPLCRYFGHFLLSVSLQHSKKEILNFPRSASSSSYCSFEINGPSQIFLPLIFLIAFKLLIIFKFSDFCGIIPSMQKSISFFLAWSCHFLVIFDCSLLVFCLHVAQGFIHASMIFSLCHVAVWKNYSLLSFFWEKAEYLIIVTVILFFKFG